jgi:hypothetical protein
MTDPEPLRIRATVIADDTPPEGMPYEQWVRKSEPVAPGEKARDIDLTWWALVMGAAAAIEDASLCLRDPDAKRAAEGAARHYRKAAETALRR